MVKTIGILTIPTNPLMAELLTIYIMSKVNTLKQIMKVLFDLFMLKLTANMQAYKLKTDLKTISGIVHIKYINYTCNIQINQTINNVFY